MTKLQHENAEQSASKVTVHYDGKIRNLEVDENGTVEVENKQELKELEESHGKFFRVNEDSEPDHVLAGMTVSEVKDYVRDITDVERLKELRQLEDRKTGKQAIDDRIEKAEKENLVENSEEVNDNDDGEGEEDGEETENE